MSSFNIKQIVFVAVAALVSIGYAVYLFLVYAINEAYPSSTTSFIYLLYAFVPAIPFLSWQGYKTIAKNRLIGWFYVLSPILWVVLSWAAGAIIFTKSAA
jgi:hypothetical protein